MCPRHVSPSTPIPHFRFFAKQYSKHTRSLNPLLETPYTRSRCLRQPRASSSRPSTRPLRRVSWRRKRRAAHTQPCRMRYAEHPSCACASPECCDPYNIHDDCADESIVVACVNSPPYVSPFELTRGAARYNCCARVPCREAAPVTSETLCHNGGFIALQEQSLHIILSKALAWVQVVGAKDAVVGKADDTRGRSALIQSHDLHKFCTFQNRINVSV